jgi:hypothetical protein
MLNRALGSGCCYREPFSAVDVCRSLLDTWKAIIVSGLLVTSGMIWHKQLRHFVLLPSCVALVSGILVILMSLK